MRSNLRFLLLVLFVLTIAQSVWCAPTYKVLHAFSGGSDGGGLWGSLTLDAEGNVYGATAADTIFELSPRLDGKWRFQVLCTLNEGSFANGGMIFDSAGNLYGTTQVGGPYDDGVVFELSPERDGWKETVLTDFPRGVPAGSPWDGPIMDSAGDLYGAGGSAFELSAGAGGWNLGILHEFTCRNGDGCEPYAGLVMDAAGNLYGTTAHGGGSNRCGAGCGTVYELSPKSDGRWKETILYNFGGAGDGVFPSLGALAIDSAGNLYGAAGGGNTGDGVIFRMSRGSNDHWKETVLYNLKGGANGDHPGGGVIIDKAGVLYGTTIAGGDPNCGCGLVYKLAPGKNGKWTYTVLHTFIGSDGAQPDANLILDNKGNLYGTTATGGTGGYGVAFELTP
jgi:uncharacterized repeat protein (TIGR03803 family)